MFSINKYFDEKVVSIAFQGEQLPATVGVISKGEYCFDTSKHETMTVVSGSMDVKLPGSEQWQTVTQGQSFEIAAGTDFHVKANADVAYLCTYA